MSKLNPQKASAYVGPGVLRKGGKITPVPNGPLIKKKGPYAGSTLRSGGTIKKAQTGATMTKRDSTVANIREQARLRQNLVDFRKKVGNKPLTPELIREKDSLTSLVKNFGTKQRMKSTGLTEKQLAKNDSIYTEQQRRKKSEEDDSGQLRCIGKDDPGCAGSAGARQRRVKREARRRNGGPIKKAQNGTSQYSDPKPLFDKIKKSKDSLDNAKIKLEERKYKAKMKYLNGKLKNEQSIMNTKKAKAGAMIKRADGSMSRRGLWDNIRANKGSGKKPTKQMLVQEKKIKAKSKK